MTMSGAAWGLRLCDVTPVAKLVAFRLGDRCDDEGRGSDNIDDLATWCCTKPQEIVEALELLQVLADVSWDWANKRQIQYGLPSGARPYQRADSAPGPERRLTLYVISGARGVKIGITGNLSRRIRGLRMVMLDDTLKAEWSAESKASTVRAAERHAHQLLAAKLIRNEWFSATVHEAAAAGKAALEACDLP